MRLHLTKREYINFHEWTIFLKNYFVCKFDKIICFHGNKDGDIFVDKWLLYTYYFFGYKFISCYPSEVRKSIRFGDFIYPEHCGRVRAEFEIDSMNGEFLIDVVIDNNEYDD